MFSLFVLEKDPLVRVDIIELVENCFTCLALTIADSVAALADGLSTGPTKKIALLSGTAAEITSVLTSHEANDETAYVIFADSARETFPNGHSIFIVPRPFTSDMLAQGIKNAIFALHSSR